MKHDHFGYNWTSQIESRSFFENYRNFLGQGKWKFEVHFLGWGAGKGIQTLLIAFSPNPMSHLKHLQQQ